MSKIKAYLLALKSYMNSSQPIDNVVQAVNAGRAEMEVRIFNSETGAKDTKGSHLGSGKYSNPYAKFREKKGRQTNNIDLEVTGSLRKSINTVNAQSRVSIAISDQEEQKIAGYLQENYKTTIFELSEEEKKFVKEQYTINIENDLKRIANGFN
jgi:hypothetical protein